jgi:hypothetical protein
MNTASNIKSGSFARHKKKHSHLQLARSPVRNAGKMSKYVGINDLERGVQNVRGVQTLRSV